jgi:hypothetical protein
MKYILLLSILFSTALFASPAKRTSVSWQVGPDSSSYNLDIGINRSSTLGIHFQQQFFKQKDSSTTYLLNGFSNYGMNYEYFLGPDQERFKSGVVLTVGVHITNLNENSIHQEITLDGKEIFTPGDSKTGGRLAACYRWYTSSIFAGVGVEGSKTGKANVFLPVKIQVGILF